MLLGRDNPSIRDATAPPRADMDTIAQVTLSHEGFNCSVASMVAIATATIAGAIRVLTCVVPPGCFPIPIGTSSPVFCLNSHMARLYAHRVTFSTQSHCKTNRINITPNAFVAYVQTLGRLLVTKLAKRPIASPKSIP